MQSGLLLAAVMLVVVACFRSSVAAPDVGASCAVAADHCDADKGHGCCLGVTACYDTTDCGTYLKTCPFTNDTKKGGPLVGCKSDKSAFEEGKCSKAALAFAKSQANPVEGSRASCFESDLISCTKYANKTHTHFELECKAPPPPAKSGAHGLLVSSCAGLLVLLAAVLL